jgi:hypothetical protein
MVQSTLNVTGSSFASFVSSDSTSESVPWLAASQTTVSTRLPAGAIVAGNAGGATRPRSPFRPVALAITRLALPELPIVIVAVGSVPPAVPVNVIGPGAAGVDSNSGASPVQLTL